MTLTNANLANATFTGAIFSGANLTGANITSAVLPVKLSCVNISGVDLKSRDMKVVNLSARTSRMRNLTNWNFTGAFFLQATVPTTAGASALVRLLTAPQAHLELASTINDPLLHI